MKETFRKNIDVFNKLAKEQVADKETDQELTRVINWHIEDAARSRATTPLTQEQIFVLQKNKQEIMVKLQKDIKDLDNPEVKVKKQPGEHVTIFHKDKFMTMFNDKPTIISKGEIFTDLEWGTEYYLDPETVPRNIRKRYLIEKAKREIANMLTSQIIKDELGSRATDSFKKTAYEGILRDAEHKVMRGGIIAEAILKNFFKKLVLDQNLELEIIDADVSQDVEAKIDFIIRRKRHIRGVNVETTENERIGVQFTTNFSAVLHKESQIRRVKERAKTEEKVVDIVLVALPMEMVMGSYNGWVANGKTPGGPDKLLPKQSKKIIFESLLQKMFTPNEIARKWNKMHNLPENTDIIPDAEIPISPIATQRDSEQRTETGPGQVDKDIKLMKEKFPFDYEVMEMFSKRERLNDYNEEAIRKIYSNLHRKYSANGSEYMVWRDDILAKLKQK